MSDNGKEYQPDYSVLNKWPVRAWKWPKPVVFVPWMQSLPYADEVLPNFLEIASMGVPFLHRSYGYAERVLNLAAWDFLEADDYTHLIILDSDHTHPVDIVQQLCRVVIEDPQRLVVGGLNYKRTPPYSPCAWAKGKDGRVGNLLEWSPGLFKAHRIGSANMIIAREVFERLDPPWFLNEYNDELMTTDGYDTFFCNKCHDEDIDIWCDTRISSPHMASMRVTERAFRTYLEMNPVEHEEVTIND